MSQLCKGRTTDKLIQVESITVEMSNPSISMGIP